MSDEIVAIAVRKRAFDGLNKAIARKAEYVAQQTNDGENDPQCGWESYDETIADYNESIVYAAEVLVDSIVSVGS